MNKDEEQPDKANQQPADAEPPEAAQQQWNPPELPPSRAAFNMNVRNKFTVRDSTFMGYEQLATGNYGALDWINNRASVPDTPFQTDLQELTSQWAHLTDDERETLSQPLKLVIEGTPDQKVKGAEMLKKLAQEISSKTIAEILFRIVKGTIDGGGF